MQIGAQNVFQRLRGSLHHHDPVMEEISNAKSPRDGDGTGDPDDCLSNALREVLVRGIPAGGPDHETRHLLRNICEAAHASHANVEDVLILLKETWMELPEARQSHYAEAQARLSHIISLCIEEYFLDQRTP